MKILDYYILKKFLKTYVFAVFLIVLIVMVIDYTEKIDDFIRKQAPMHAIIFDYYLNFNEIIKNNFNETIIQYILYNNMSFELF